ncbi:MAG: alpha/beta hydrolase fold domain-containing protein [Burkholderiaceae bacterium]|nr:alpha/beta hydrolase fold domain-containing protein [Burkholderiaceae bacterium]
MRTDFSGAWLVWLMLSLAVAAVVVAGALRCKRQAQGPDEIRVYKRIAGHALNLHVFHARQLPRASGAQGRRTPAALLLFHGGGWGHGSPRQFFPQCRELSRLGITCISVEYRIASRHGSTPSDAVDDAHAALHWVRTQAPALGLDPARVAAGGGSAGGHLAAALGTGIRAADHGADPTAARPRALLLLNPMLDLSPGQPDHDRVGADWQALSPMHHVGPDVPPTLVLNGTHDPEVPVATVQAFCAKVKAAGTTCELQLFTGAGHGFFNPEVDDGRRYGPALAHMRRFLHEQGLL